MIVSPQRVIRWQDLKATRHALLMTRGQPSDVSFCTIALKTSGRDRARLVSLYFARLAGFLPAVLPGMMEGAELVADGLGLAALGFLASRLLRFWLLAMLFSTAVGELSNSDRVQVRRD